MQLKRLLLIALACAVCIAAGGVAPALAAETTSIALTMTKSTDAGKEDPVAVNLLTLVGLAVQADKSLAVVERREIDLALQELVLDQARPGDAQLQLGKLITADVLAMLEMLPADKDSQKPWGRLRVVDPKTAAIRGVTVASIDEATLEETAEQFAHYVSAVISAPERRTITVAVAPFESKGRFDRLRPLELGIRDLITARLLALSGASTDSTKTEKAEPRQPSRFQVLQRSSMEQLLRELDLIQSGLSDKSRLPEQLPARGAAYLVRGELDERQNEDKYTIIVRAEIVDAVSERIGEKFELECSPADLESQLARQVDRIVERIWKDEKIGSPVLAEGTFEVQSLKQLAMADVGRFARLSATFYAQSRFTLDGNYPFVVSPAANPATPVGRHVLQKSIDRLESILFINPDDAEAAYALGFCYSIHEQGIYQPDRADELLRKAYALGPETILAALALKTLTAISYDDRVLKIDVGSESKSVERMWFAFEHMPVAHRDQHWPQLLNRIVTLQNRAGQTAAIADLLAKTAPFVEDCPEANRQKLVEAVENIAVSLARRPKAESPRNVQGLELLERWAAGEDRQRAYYGQRGLADLKSGSRDYLGAAIAYEQCAAKVIDLESHAGRDRHDRHLVDAAKNYRLAGQPERALELLLSFEAETVSYQFQWARENPLQSGTNLLGFHGFEVGDCYLALGQPEKAVAAYVQATERCPSITDQAGTVEKIVALGGVPLRKDRDIDVRYFVRPGKHAEVAYADQEMHLATDGRKIYFGDVDGLHAFDIADEKWEPTRLKPDRVTCLLADGGQLWAGTQADGLWRGDLSSGEWRPIGAGQLPDQNVESLALAGGDLYAGVGTHAAGGLVRIDGDEKVQVFSDSNAPSVAPTHIVFVNQGLLARTPRAIHELSFETKSWSRQETARPGHIVPPVFFAGRSGIWAAERGRELTRREWTAEQNEFFRPTWYIPANNTGYVVNFTKVGYLASFVSEHEDEVWFGGEQKNRFVNSGLYRFNSKTGAFYKFGPGDGFKACRRHRVYDGLWLDDRLWLATDEGLCLVTPIH